MLAISSLSCFSNFDYKVMCVTTHSAACKSLSPDIPNNKSFALQLEPFGSKTKTWGDQETLKCPSEV